MSMVLGQVLILLTALAGLALAGYPAHYEVGYGFVNHGGVGPHGHYLPAVARVKVHKDPYQSSYSLDEEGPTHYKYVRQSSINPVIHAPPPAAAIVAHEPIHHHHHGQLIHHAHHDHGIHGQFHHHHHAHVHPIDVTAAVPFHGGVIAAEVPGLSLGLVAPTAYYDGYNYGGWGLY